MIKIYRKLSAVCLLVLLALLTGCEDKFDYRIIDITEGESFVEVEASFRDFAPTLQSRAAGDAIQSIDKLLVFIYDEKDGKPCVIKDSDGNEQFPLVFGKDDLTRVSADGSTDCRVTFSMRLPNGRYRMYAVANMDYETDLKSQIDLGENEYPTEFMLMTMSTRKWSSDISKNTEMFGRFDSNTGESFVEAAGNDWTEVQAPTVVVNGRTSLHVWLRRCASKVTIEYDGSGLYDGVSIMLMSATIKDIPATCTLGVHNAVTSEARLIEKGEIFDYYDGDNIPTPEDFRNGVGNIIDNKTKWPENAHSDTADALYFYENMQGVYDDREHDKTQKDDDGDGVLDYYNKDNVKYGSYIEVEAVYLADIPATATEPAYKSSGRIIYRFMLGKNITNDFNAERNCHYKLTLRFKNKGNDFDWHIDYRDQILGVTEPRVFDYQGKVFVPDKSVPNFDHTFVYENTVKLSSYVTDDMGHFYPTEVYIKPHGADDSQYKKYVDENSHEWLTVDMVPSTNPYDRDVTFKVKQTSIDCRSFTMDELFATKKSVSENENAPFNLANPGQGAVSAASATILNTANCYMISAPGWYMLPLVYGNAIEGGNTSDKSSYQPGVTGADELGKFKDYLGKDIDSPYIKDSGRPVSAFLVWQDEDNLIKYNMWEWLPDIRLDMSAYGGVGGLKFYVETIKEGNAVIAVSDQERRVDNTIFAESYAHDVPDAQRVPRAMWSWHIWATCFDGFGDDQTIEVIGHYEEKTEAIKPYNLMPVNLGWCSEGEKITYYPGRACDVKFKAGKEEVTITIEQKSHIALPRGNCTYYQWGRKDPFVGTSPKSKGYVEGNAGEDANKTYYVSKGWGGNPNPTRYTYDIADDEVAENELAKGRKTTVNILHELIQRPYVFHNPPRKGGVRTKYASTDKIYFNLWDGRNNKLATEPKKTIYDPCPYGYQVPHYKAFSGLTVTGGDASRSQLWYNVRNVNINTYVGGGRWENNKLYHEQLYEFYTSPEKCQSIVFPQVGYRDWDAFAYIYKVGGVGSIGYCWTAHIAEDSDVKGLSNYEHIASDMDAHNRAFNLEYTRLDNFSEDGWGSYIRPQNLFYPCDAFPIRPSKQSGK